MRITYDSLPTKFVHCSFDMEQLWREKDVAVFKQSNVYCTRYETIIVQFVQQGTAFGKEYPAREIYPNSEAWGEHGFTYVTEEQAMKKARNLLKGHKSRMENLAAREDKKLAKA